MMTENDNWHDGSSEENSAGRDGNRSYNDHNRRDDSRYNNRSYDRTSNSRYNNQAGRFEKPQRPRINREGGSYERVQRPRFNSNENEGGFERPQRLRINRDNNPGNSYNNNRPSYGNNNNRNWRSNNDGGGSERRWNNNNPKDGERPRFRRPSTGGYNSGGYNSGGYNRDSNSGGYTNNRGGYSNNRGGYNNNRSNSYGQNQGYRPRYNNNQGGGFGRPQRRSDDYNPNDKYSKRKQIEYRDILTDPNEPIRLNKYLANAGVCSRREADEFITLGVVSVNGEVVTELGTKVLRTDVVKFREEAVSLERKVYVLLNKPKDCVTTSDDPQERRTVIDLIKDTCDERIYPADRLDRNTTGVLLLTNDGDLASKLTHPKFLKKKIYHVFLDKNLTKNDMDQIAAGIQLDDGKIRADSIHYTDNFKKNEVGIEIHSGKNRIVRRIFKSLGYKVIKLDRVFFAGLTKKGLRRGDWRYLTESEVNMLRMGAFE
ncbi:MAG: rRNA pseudouridine synthase [Bacteroides sp.]|nr:rRNA pseudouridine synthase [Bacteroides sp.]